MTPLERALQIRLFEQRLMRLYEAGHLFGTVHTCVGQEMVGIAAAEAFSEGDVFCSNHRGHGHFLALTGDQEGLLAEVLGRRTGVCGGRGGTQHLFHPKGFYSNGIQGGMAPVATGMALAAELSGSPAIVFLFVGDGTMGEGAFYESLNIASKWSLPLLVVVENNGIAQTTPSDHALAGTIAGRANGFGVQHVAADTWDWERLISVMQAASRSVRESRSPMVVEVATARLNPHSKGDDTRPPELLAELWTRDPVQRWLESDASGQERQTELERALDELTVKVLEAPAPEPPSRDEVRMHAGESTPAAGPRRRVVEEINRGLTDWMREDSRVVMIGQDLQSPYGGAFKVTKGLSEAFPERVLTTPISESAIVGIGTGLALRGGRPVVEIMFGDFLGLAFDQLLNHAAKFPYMYDGRVEVPLVVRTPMGGYRGYGPTHSQSLEKHLLGIPGLTVIAPNYRVSPFDLYRNLGRTVRQPTLIVENKLLYTRFVDPPLPIGYVRELIGGPYPTLRVYPAGKACDATLLCYGGMLELAESALMELFREHDVLAEIVCPSRLYPLELNPISDSVSRTGALVTIEEGLGFCGFAAEVLSQLSEAGTAPRRARRLSASHIIPAARSAEEEVLPSVGAVVRMVAEVAGARVY